MTLDDTLLEKLAEWSPPGDGRQTFAFADGDSGVAVGIAFDQFDALSGRVWEANLTRSTAAIAREPTLAGWAKAVADRATGLLEPLKLIEVDPALGRAMLRSEQPAKKNEDRFYYEVLLHEAGTADVKRYRGSAEESRREQIGFALTREAIAKLMRDIVE